MSVEKIHKIGNFCVRYKIPFVPFVAKLLIRLIYNCAVDPSTIIGKGTKFAYGGIATVIHKKAVIGENVMIGQCVTIGGRSGIKTLPVIGDGVYIGAGAKILGDVRIDDHSVIGANAVVINDVGKNTVFAGVPAREIKKYEI